MRGSDNQGTARRRRILVVEDNLDAVHSLTVLLRELGHEVEFAINGYAALEIARQLKPEVVLLDIGLPGMDGFELCRRLKREPAFAAARVIAVTGYGQEPYRERALAAGCDAYLVKPLDPKALYALLE
jgi:two-component system, OmpR family, response regulator